METLFIRLNDKNKLPPEFLRVEFPLLELFLMGTQSILLDIFLREFLQVESLLVELPLKGTPSIQLNDMNRFPPKVLKVELQRVELFLPLKLSYPSFFFSILFL